MKDHPLDAEMSNQGIGERAGDQESKKKTHNAPRKSAKPDGAVRTVKQKVASHGEAVEQYGEGSSAHSLEMVL